MDVIVRAEKRKIEMVNDKLIKGEHKEAEAITVTKENKKEVPNEINVKKVYIDGNSNKGGK